MSDTASRYAKALFNFAKDEDFRKPLKDFWGLLMLKPHIHRFFNAPNIPERVKVEVLEKGVKLPSNLLLFLKLLLQNRRFSLLEPIIDKYSAFVREKLGIEVALLKSAIPLSEEQKKGVLDKLKSYAGKQIELEVLIDPKLLGGGILTLNHHLIDFSIKGKLARLEEELVK